MHAFPEYYRVGWNCLVLLSLLVEQLNVINPPGPQFVSLTFVTVTGLSFLIALKGAVGRRRGGAPTIGLPEAALTAEYLMLGSLCKYNMETARSPNARHISIRAFDASGDCW